MLTTYEDEPMVLGRRDSHKQVTSFVPSKQLCGVTRGIRNIGIVRLAIFTSQPLVCGFVGLWCCVCGVAVLQRIHALSTETGQHIALGLR